jgi:hypothetical protein
MTSPHSRKKPALSGEQLMISVTVLLASVSANAPGPARARQPRRRSHVEKISSNPIESNHLPANPPACQPAFLAPRA